jgi:glycosyltransferase involved in cell wall biosynthesis
MSRRVVVVTEIIAPYRIPVFNALARTPGLDLQVIFLAENDPTLRQWKVHADEIRFRYKVLPSWRRRIGNYNALVNWGIDSSLQDAAPETVVCGGYSYLASWTALRWAKKRGVAFSCWVESTGRDRRRAYPSIEFLKSTFLNRCDSFIVPGKASFDYLQSYGVSRELIFTAPNAVDLARFSQEANAIRKNSTAVRHALGLPERYFLFVGRLVEAKGILDLLEAYAGLGARIRDHVGLIFAGDGAARSQAQRLASKISGGRILFAGFLQQEQLPAYYALADALVFPTHSDTWGLVVNEAMACGLPVISSEVAGSSIDLVRCGWNGFVTHPRDVSGITDAMNKLAGDAELRTYMGLNSRNLISGYTPEACAAGIAEAVGARWAA